MNYTVNFTIEDNIYSEFKGFIINQGEGYFEPGWTTELIFHDIFEHFFEDSEFFKTAQLSQAGECVALGIRTYLDQSSSLITKFASYNKFQGCEWNTWNTIISQVGENLDKDAYTQYPNDFKYITLPNYKSENLFEGYVETYNKYYKINKKLSAQIEKAVSYGYWLGEEIHKNRLEEIYNFMENTKEVWSILGLNNLDMYDSHPYLDKNTTLEVNVTDNLITAKLKNYSMSIEWSNEDLNVDKIYEELEKLHAY